LKSIYATYIVISCAEATSNNANLDGIKFGPFKGGKTYQEVMFNARTAGFSELIKRRFVIGSFALMSENREELFIRAQRNRAKIVEATNEILKDYDAIYLPASPTTAPLLNGSGDKLSNEYLIADNFMAIGNFAGLPSVTVPLTFIDGLPIGVNFTSKAFSEADLLSIIDAFEGISGLKGISTNVRKEAKL
jgi:aspartyl-tRNA(Asn)/glutamyl-tRNA(Gln) amidotransferase subunit A